MIRISPLQEKLCFRFVVSIILLFCLIFHGIADDIQDTDDPDNLGDDLEEPTPEETDIPDEYQDEPTPEETDIPDEYQDEPFPEETDFPDDYQEEPISEEYPIEDGIPQEEIPEYPQEYEPEAYNATDAIIPDISSEESAFSQPYRNSSVLVQFDPRSDTIPLKIHSAIGAKIAHDFTGDGIPGLELVSSPDIISVEQAVSYYQSQPGVLYAEPDYYRFVSRTPSDPDFWRQWPLENTGQVYRENVTAGKEGSDIRTSGAWETTTGGETLVAVLDSGVDYLHPDLASNIVTDPENGTAGYDAITGETDAMDLASHGTHSAGIIGAVGENSLGMAGVNWNTRIIPVRFLNSFGTGTISDEIESILWAKNNGARIISCSYGGNTYSRAEYEVMKDSDALFICAAGNSGVNSDENPSYPSCLNLTNIISVAATDSSDKLANFSNYGKNSVDIGAPGVDIFSTKHNIYKPVPIWTDPCNSFQNWTKHGNWTINDSQYVTPNTSVRAVVNKSSSDLSSMPAILTLNTPLPLSEISHPVLSYQWSLVASNYSFSIEGSADGVSWIPFEYGKGTIMVAPFMKRECKIPADFRGGHLFIRFIIDGDTAILGLDDLTLSDGYGDLVKTRWGYMDGTSMACPHVSGAAALLASANPDASPADIRKVLLSTTRPVSSLSGKTVTGGVINVTAAINSITGGSAYHLKLSPGWNHVSMPYRLVSDNNTAGEIFGPLSNVSGHSLYRYDSGNWVTVGSGEHILPLISYWVYTGSKASLPLMVEQNQSGEYSRNLTTGWNGFGITGGEPLVAKDELTSLSEIWSYIIGFNTSSQIYDEPIIRGGQGKQNETRTLSPYQGYWLFMIKNGTFKKNDSQVVDEPTAAPVWPEPLK